MKRNIELNRIRRGEHFTLDGVEFVKLDEDGADAFALMADVIPETCPFERDEDREDANNFDGSYIQGVIYRWAEQHKGIYDAMEARTIDLTTMDGMADYGRPTVNARLLTIDEYRRYRPFIPLASSPFWLATGWTTISSPYSNDSGAYCVNTSGALSSGSVNYANYYCPRPAFYLKSDIFVSIEEDGAKGDLGAFTTEELLKELWRRADTDGHIK